MHRSALQRTGIQHRLPTTTGRQLWRPWFPFAVSCCGPPLTTKHTLLSQTPDAHMACCPAVSREHTMAVCAQFCARRFTNPTTHQLRSLGGHCLECIQQAVEGGGDAGDVGLADLPAARDGDDRGTAGRALSNQHQGSSVSSGSRSRSRSRSSDGKQVAATAVAR